MMTVPRTVSTAFERSMMARGDHKVFHEPWNSEYIYRNHLGSAPSEELIQAGGYEGVKELFYKYAEQKHVYVKDMIWVIQEELLNDEALLSDPNVVLTILIRNPSLSIESFFLKISKGADLDQATEITRWVFRYDALVRLAEKYHKIRGEWPLIVEAEELCTIPASVMQNYCQKAAIPFLPEALVWEKTMPEEWEHTKRLHEDAAESKGFFIPSREAKIRFSAIPSQCVSALEAIYQEQKPYYEQLKQLKAQNPNAKE
jgi:hypothetical protein